MLELIKKELEPLTEIKDIYQLLLNDNSNYSHVFFVRIDNKYINLNFKNDEYELQSTMVMIDNVEMNEFSIRIFKKKNKEDVIKKCLKHIRCSFNPAKVIMEEIND